MECSVYKCVGGFFFFGGGIWQSIRPTALMWNCRKMSLQWPFWKYSNQWPLALCGSASWSEVWGRMQLFKKKKKQKKKIFLQTRSSNSRLWWLLGLWRESNHWSEPSGSHWARAEGHASPGLLENSSFLVAGPDCMHKSSATRQISIPTRRVDQSWPRVMLWAAIIAEERWREAPLAKPSS